MRFRVPQFIDIEDKIVGPLTLKQFLYLLGGVGVLAMLWFYLKLTLFIIIAVPIAILVLGLAFYKVNGRPFVYLLGSLIKYMTKPKLYLWKRGKK